MYQLLLLFVFMTYAGYRVVRYQNSFIHLNCHSMECHVKIQPSGWYKPVQVTIAREQITETKPVKTKRDGTFVTGENVSPDDYQRTYDVNDKKKKNKKRTSNYKGPSDDGNYITYAIWIRDRSPHESTETSPHGENHPADGNPTIPYKSLAPISKYLQVSSESNEAGVGTEYRLVMKQFTVVQSRRRVRTMVQKISGYIRRRRQQVIIKENANVSWVGVLLITAGIIGFLLSLLLGQLWIEDDAYLKAQHQRKQLARQRIATNNEKRRKEQAHSEKFRRAKTGTAPNEHYGGFRPENGTHAQQQPSQRSRRRVVSSSAPQY